MTEELMKLNYEKSELSIIDVLNDLTEEEQKGYLGVLNAIIILANHADSTYHIALDDVLDHALELFYADYE